MKILCPYIGGMLRDETEAALSAYFLTRFHMLDSRDPFAYGRLLAEYWREAEDFLIVEQDILPSESDVELMRTCPHPYCGAPYAWKTDVGVALGFTRFRREFLLKYPNLLDKVCNDIGWKQLDVTIQRHILVSLYGEQPHVHPEVVHLNEEKKLMEGADPTPLKELPSW